MPEETQSSEVQSTGTSSGTEIGNASGTQAPESSEATPKEVLSPQKEVVGSGEVEKPEYTPNYKFKVHDKEQEFDEFIRSGIKDVDTEKKARELYEKAYGLDFVKPKYEDLKKKYPELETQYKQLDTTVNEILDYRDKGDLDSVFNAMRIPEEQVAKWMLAKIQKMELPPEQRAVYDQFEETKRQNQLLQKQFQELNGQTQTQAVQARTFELESNLQRPDVSSFAAAFDAMRKTPGAFKEEVRKCGLYEWKINNTDITAADAIQRVMSGYQGMIVPGATGTSTEPVGRESLPVIPRLQGKAVSATSKQVRSIADLKKKAAEMAG